MIKELRKGRRLPLRHVAEELGVSESFLSQVENGNRRPSLELITALASYYKTNVDVVSISLGVIPQWVLDRLKEAPFEVVNGAKDSFSKYGKQEII